MTIWLSYLLVFVGGYLVINYFPQLLDLGIQHLINSETFKASRLQKLIDEDEVKENEVLPSQIGFHQYEDDSEYITDDERDD